jgi:hypothetical protein
MAEHEPQMTDWMKVKEANGDESAYYEYTCKSAGITVLNEGARSVPSGPQAGDQRATGPSVSGHGGETFPDGDSQA